MRVANPVDLQILEHIAACGHRRAGQRQVISRFPLLLERTPADRPSFGSGRGGGDADIPAGIDQRRRDSEPVQDADPLVDGEPFGDSPQIEPDILLENAQRPAGRNAFRLEKLPLIGADERLGPPQIILRGSAAEPAAPSPEFDDRGDGNVEGARGQIAHLARPFQNAVKRLADFGRFPRLGAGTAGPNDFAFRIIVAHHRVDFVEPTVNGFGGGFGKVWRIGVEDDPYRHRHLFAQIFMALRHTGFGRGGRRRKQEENAGKKAGPKPAQFPERDSQSDQQGVKCHRLQYSPNRRTGKQSKMGKPEKRGSSAGRNGSATCTSEDNGKGSRGSGPRWPYSKGGRRR